MKSGIFVQKTIAFWFIFTLTFPFSVTSSTIALPYLVFSKILLAF